MNTVIHTDRSAIRNIAYQMARDNGEDPEGYLDYSDLRNGKHRWEYFEGAAKEKHREDNLELLVEQVVKMAPKTTADAVRAAVTILEGASDAC